MKVLVIGGTNFIGLYFVRQLVEMGHDVTMFHRGQTTAELPKEVKCIKGDKPSAYSSFVGDRTVKKSRYIPKGLLARVEKLEPGKVPVRKILEVLWVKG